MKWGKRLSLVLEHMIWLPGVKSYQIVPTLISFREIPFWNVMVSVNKRLISTSPTTFDKFERGGSSEFPILLDDSDRTQNCSVWEKCSTPSLLRRHPFGTRIRIFPDYVCRTLSQWVVLRLYIAESCKKNVSTYRIVSQKPVSHVWDNYYSSFLHIHFTSSCQLLVIPNSYRGKIWTPQGNPKTTSLWNWMQEQKMRLSIDEGPVLVFSWWHGGNCWKNYMWWLYSSFL